MKTARGAQLVLFILVSLLSAGRAGAVSALVLDGPVRVRAEKTEEVGGKDGFLPLEVELENLDPIPRVARLSFETQPATRIRAAAALAPGERRRLTLLVPAFVRHGMLRARVEGSDAAGSEGFSWPWTRFAPVLVEGPKGAERLFDKKGGRRLYGNNAEEPLLVLEAGQLPETLAGLVGFAAVALLETPLDRLAEPQRRALEAYVATGGTLYLPRGRGESGLLLASHDAGGVAPGSYPVGFGRLVACAEGCDREIAGRSGVENILRPARSSDSVNPAPLRTRSFGPVNTQLLDVAEVPAGGFLLIVLLFTAVLGPGSFLVRRRFGPPALMAFIPGTALVACLGIAAFGVLREGLFTLHASSRAVTFLDSARNRATTAAVTGFYATLAPREVRFGALETPVLGDVGGESVEIDQTEGIVFTRGLITSRNYRELLTVAVAPTRARLSLKRDGDRLLVENALGARITEGEVRWEGEYCRFRAIPDGGAGPATCDMPPHTPDEILLPLDERFTRSILDATLLTDLQEGEFRVQLEQAVFASDGGLKLKRQRDAQLVRGRVWR